MIVVSAIVIIALVLIAAFVALYMVEEICDLFKLRKNKDEPYYKLDLSKQLVTVEIAFLYIVIDILSIYLIVGGEYIMPDILVDIIVGVISSIVVSAFTTIFIYFKYLKHIPDETRKQMDKLLNERLNYETANHNSELQKSDYIRESLSREHSELRGHIVDANKGIDSISRKFDSEKELKELRYQYLQNNDKALIDSINKLMALGDALERVNFENKNLEAENKALELENAELKSRLAQAEGAEQERKVTPKL
ncbi:MAG: hypothetical protein ACI4XP_03690 [Acutalibacteraceae bacterium]